MKTDKKSQNKKLYEFLSDGKTHSVNEIIEYVYPKEKRKYTPARVASRINDLKNEGIIFLDKLGNEIPLKGPNGKPLKRGYRNSEKEYCYRIKVNHQEVENRKAVEDILSKWREEKEVKTPTQVNLFTR